MKECIKISDSNKRSIPFSPDSGTAHLPSGTQAIITTYKFRCCGRIAAWQLYIQPEADEPLSDQYVIHFQVWRPLPTVQSTGCYTLVGFDKFTGRLGGRGIVSKVLDPNHNLEFQPGDVVGLFVFKEESNNASATNRGGIMLDTTYVEEKVWFHTYSEEDPLKLNEEHLCPLPVGAERKLNGHINAAPIISIQTGL